MSQFCILATGVTWLQKMLYHFIRKEQLLCLVSFKIEGYIYRHKRSGESDLPPRVGTTTGIKLLLKTKLLLLNTLQRLALQLPVIN